LNFEKPTKQLLLLLSNKNISTSTLLYLYKVPVEFYIDHLFVKCKNIVKKKIYIPKEPCKKQFPFDIKISVRYKIDKKKKLNKFKIIIKNIKNLNTSKNQRLKSFPTQT